MAAHPRVCGENTHIVNSDTPQLGSSPRVRGKHFSPFSLMVYWGLIPACAGKTSHEYMTASMRWAHPRVCGENEMEECTDAYVEGSSPRVRGKRSYDPGRPGG
mgnify:CR=1 FL=1